MADLWKPQWGFYKSAEISRNRNSCHISFTWMQIGTGMAVCHYWYDFYLLLVNKYKSIELDDILSYECARENVSMNNMDRIGWDDMELCIHLEKTTREGRILFIFERSLESKYIKLYICTSIPFCKFFFIIICAFFLYIYWSYNSFL